MGWSPACNEENSNWTTLWGLAGPFQSVYAKRDLWENTMNMRTKRLSRRLRFWVQISGVFMAVSATAIVMLGVAVLTAFQARRFNTEVIGRAGAKVVLWILGVRLEVHQERPFPQTQAVYISNHTSSLDVVVIIALGLPRARFFMKGYVRKYIPVGLVAYLVGTFFTVPQEFPEKRRRLFQRAERVLRWTGDSVFLTPEGKITLTGEIGPFNKGAFHLATNLAAPIVPLYIQIPREVDPGDGFEVRSRGTVHVFVRDPIPTSSWALEALEQNRDRMHEYYVRLHKELLPRN
jgi:1-acyl-sn-glycerol-3-phosphate acyltransferase